MRSIKVCNHSTLTPCSFLLLAMTKKTAHPGQAPGASRPCASSNPPPAYCPTPSSPSEGCQPQVRSKGKSKSWLVHKCQKLYDCEYKMWNYDQTPRFVYFLIAIKWDYLPKFCAFTLFFEISSVCIFHVTAPLTQGGVGGGRPLLVRAPHSSIAAHWGPHTCKLVPKHVDRCYKDQKS